jgi:hypothetical protein
VGRFEVLIDDNFRAISGHLFKSLANTADI